MPCSSTYFSGSTSVLNISSKTSFAAPLLITLSSISLISFERFAAENFIWSGSMPSSLQSLIVSPIIQLLTSLGLLPRATVSSNKSAKGLYNVIISASYSGSSNSSTYLAIFSSLNSGSRDFTS